jgi:hypothetical protein
MAIGNVLGRAYIEIHADTKPFAKELGVEVAAIAKAVEAKSKGSGKKVAEDVIKGAEEEVKSSGRRVFDSLLDLFRSPNNKRRTSKAGEEAGNIFVEAFRKAGSSVAGIIPSLGSSIGNVGSGGPFAWIIGLGVVTLIPAIIALVSQLAGLLNIVLLLPGALSAVLAAVLPLVVAFQGFGEAISAITSGDPEDIADALSKLTPSARGVAREFQRLLPLFRQLKQVAQEGFFSPLTGKLTELFKQLGPTLVQGFADLANTAGRFTGRLLTLFSSESGKRFFATMFRLADLMERNIGPGVVKLVDGLMRLSTASAPALAIIFDRIGNTLGRFGDWLTKISQNGQLDTFLEKFNGAFDKLKELGGATFDLIGALLGSTDRQNAAKTFFDKLVSTIEDLAFFFQSEDAKKGMQQLITDAGLFLEALRNILTFIILIFSWVQSLIDAVKELVFLIQAAFQSMADLAKFDIVGTVGGALAKKGPGPRDRGFAAGGIVDTPAWRYTGEAGAEAIIPLTDPNRARQLANESGLTSMLGGGDTSVIVFIGDEQIEAKLVKVVDKSMRGLAQGMKYGPRTVGAH